VAGGMDVNANQLASAELYDPKKGKWSVTGSMSVGRTDFTATLLQNGEVLVAGVAKDMTQAADRCRKAAEAGDTTAMYFIAKQYRFGSRVPKDEAQAVNWYRKMAEAGDASGMYCLGEMYESGAGVPKDQAQALDWYRKAAPAGDSWAQDRLKELGRTVDGWWVHGKLLICHEKGKSILHS